MEGTEGRRAAGVTQEVFESCDQSGSLQKNSLLPPSPLFLRFLWGESTLDVPFLSVGELSCSLWMFWGMAHVPKSSSADTLECPLEMPAGPWG